MLRRTAIALASIVALLAAQWQPALAAIGADPQRASRAADALVLGTWCRTPPPGGPAGGEAAAVDATPSGSPADPGTGTHADPGCALCAACCVATGAGRQTIPVAHARPGRATRHATTPARGRCGPRRPRARAPPPRS